MFEKAKFKEMHQVILDDDGTPNLIEVLRDIRFDMNRLDAKGYKGGLQ